MEISLKRFIEMLRQIVPVENLMQPKSMTQVALEAKEEEIKVWQEEQERKKKEAAMIIKPRI